MASLKVRNMTNDMSFVSTSQMLCMVQVYWKKGESERIPRSRKSKSTPLSIDMSVDSSKLTPDRSNFQFWQKFTKRINQCLTFQNKPKHHYIASIAFYS